MKLKALIQDDDAVSPVIGVILMVAITVILAAVIASFVLGLGDTADEVQPTTTFSFDTEDDGSGNPIVTITLTDGDTVEFDELILRGEAAGNDGGESISDLESSYDGEEWNVGQSIELEDGGGDVDVDGLTDGELRLVWEELDGDNAATLSTHDVPDL